MTTRSGPTAPQPWGGGESLKEGAGRSVVKDQG